MCAAKYGVLNSLERGFALDICNDWTSLHLYPNKGTYGQTTRKRLEAPAWLDLILSAHESIVTKREN
jgi:hypothetical protein